MNSYTHDVGADAIEAGRPDAFSESDRAMQALIDAWDWKRPPYQAVQYFRARRLETIRQDPERYLPGLRAWYADNLADFIDDWGSTVDPRNVDLGLPAVVPFVLFPKQREWLNWVQARWMARERGLTEKSRDVGISWLAIGLSCSMCLFRRGMVIGFGSNLERNVDLAGEPKSLFWKARQFMTHVPAEFTNGWSPKDAPSMRIKFPATDSIMTGDAGDEIGRGGRTSLYFVDEAAHLERPESVEASLSANTNCRIDMSSVCGMNNPFATRRWGGKTKVFTFHWRDDPRKDDAWYAKQQDELDSVTVAQEIDIDYHASQEGILIPSAWVQSAIGFAERFGIEVTGGKDAGYDVADEGKDNLAWAGRRGIRLEQLKEWSGKGLTIYTSTEKVFNFCEAYGVARCKFDADGLGAGVRGDAQQINDQRLKARRPRIEFMPFRGSGGVLRPDKPIPTAIKGKTRGPLSPFVRTNKDYFANAKAQEWWELRLRFERVHMVVTEGGLERFDVDDLITIDPALPMLGKLITELSQPTYAENGVGKIVVAKQDPSPNLADSTMICYSTLRREGYSLEDMRRALA